MNIGPPSYSEWDSYFFVAYSRRDSDVVHDEIVWLQQHGYRIAYDEGINPGSPWSEVIAERIQYCDRFIFFISRDSVVSEHCKRELSFALEEGKEVIAIHLEDIAVPPGIRLSLNNRQAINRFALSKQRYREKITEALSGGQKHHSPTPVAQPENPVLDRIHIYSETNDHSSVPATVNARDEVLRYLSWQGGVYVVHSAAPPRRRNQASYTFGISYIPIAGGAAWSWHLTSDASNKILVSRRETATESELRSETSRLFATVAERILHAIAVEELETIKGSSLAELSYHQLIMRADQLNYLDRVDLQQRKEAIERAIKLAPFSGAPLALMASLRAWRLINGLSAESEGEQKRLSAEARQALRLEGSDPYVLLNIGMTYGRMGKYDPAINLLRRARDIAPTVKAIDHLACGLSFAGRPEEAIPLFQEAIMMAPSGIAHPYHVRLAVAQTQSGMLEKALENAELSVTNHPGDYYGWFVQANLLEHAGRREDALAAIEAGLEASSDNLNLRMVISNTNATYGRTSEQRQLLTGGLEKLASVLEA